MGTIQSFGDFLKTEIGPNWVLARQTPRIIKRYGQHVVCLSQKQYSRLEAKYERKTLRSANDPNMPSKALCATAPQLLEAANELKRFGAPGTIGCWCNNGKPTHSPGCKAMQAAIKAATE